MNESVSGLTPGPATIAIAAEGVPAAPVPAVSVVVVTKDRPRFLAQSLASLAAQSLKPEVVVVRAAGDQTSADALDAWSGFVSKVVAAEHGERASARNLGLAAATGDFVLFLDDDDLLDGAALELLYTTAERQGAGIVRGARERVSAETTSPWRPSRWSAAGLQRIVGWREVVVGAETLTPSQTLFRRELVARIPFEEEFVPIEDFVFGARAAHAAGGFVALSQVTTGYRVHPNQSRARYGIEEVRDLQLGARRRLFRCLPVDRRTRKRSMAHFHLYVEAAAAGDQDRPGRMIVPVVQAARSSPTSVLTSMWWKAFSLPGRRAVNSVVGRRRVQLCPSTGQQDLLATVRPAAERWRQHIEGRPPGSLVVSVIIAGHNQPAYLRQALESLGAQTHTELDVIVVDDASEPALKDIVDSVGDPRVRYLRVETNRERAGARNIGLNAAYGDFFLVLDHDDLLDPEAIEELVRCAGRSQADVVFGRTEAIPSDTVASWRSDSPRRPEEVEPIDWTEIFRFRWPIGNALYASWYIRELAFLHRAIPADDYQFAMEAALLGRAVRANVPVGGWRQHPGQTSASLDDRAVSRAVKRAQDVFLATYSVSGPTKRRMLGYQALYQQGYVAWRSADWRRLAGAAVSAAWNHPAILSDLMWWKAIGSAAKQAARGPRGAHPPAAGRPGPG